MKRLNKKGFTLIELLAVIVILAVVMVVTIPSVLNSMAGARQKQFENAIKSIEDYAKKNIELCNFGSDINTEFNKNIFVTDTCNVDTTKGTDIITAAGYDSTKDITSITINASGNITAATAGNDGKFKGAIYR